MRGDEGLGRLSEVLGAVTAAVLWASQGDPQAYPHARAYLKSCGLNLKERSSGKHHGQLKLTKRGPGVVRFYLYYAALRLIARNAYIRRWYEIKQARPGAIKGKLVTALMRKLALGLWHVARGERFEPERLVNLAAVQGA